MDPVLAFAESRAHVGYMIDAHTYQVMVHLAKLYMFPGAQQHNHWCHEVWVQLKSVPTLKPSTKRPDWKFIFEHSWEMNVDFLKDAIEEAVSSEEELTPRADANSGELSAMMEQYFIWLSTELSKANVHSSDVYPKLEELGF